MREFEGECESATAIVVLTRWRRVAVSPFASGWSSLYFSLFCSFWFDLYDVCLQQQRFRDGEGGPPAPRGGHAGLQRGYCAERDGGDGQRASRDGGDGQRASRDGGDGQRASRDGGDGQRSEDGGGGYLRNFAQRVTSDACRVFGHHVADSSSDAVVFGAVVRFDCHGLAGRCPIYCAVAFVFGAVVHPAGGHFAGRRAVSCAVAFIVGALPRFDCGDFAGLHVPLAAPRARRQRDDGHGRGFGGDGVRFVVPVVALPPRGVADIAAAAAASASAGWSFGVVVVAFTSLPVRGVVIFIIVFIFVYVVIFVVIFVFIFPIAVFLPVRVFIFVIFVSVAVPVTVSVTVPAFRRFAVFVAFLASLPPCGDAVFTLLFRRVDAVDPGLPGERHAGAIAACRCRGRHAVPGGGHRGGRSPG